MRSFHPICLWLVQILFLCHMQLSAIGATYYIAASGSNSNDGLSPSTAWRDVDALDARTFTVGDQVLFRRGDSFAGAAILSGYGAPDNVILVGAYGTGAKPLLTGRSDTRYILSLEGGSDYFEFENLQLSNDDTTVSTVKERYGIYILAGSGAGSVNHLHFRNLDIFYLQGSGRANAEDDHRSIGIMAEVEDVDSEGVRFNNFVIEGCTFTNIDGLGAQLRDLSQSLADSRLRGTAYYPTEGFVFQNNTGTNIYRNLLMLRGTKGAVVQHNRMDGTTEGSAFWPFDAEGTLVQYNVFMNLRAFDADAYACHFDYNCVDTVMQYNIGYNIEGGLIEIIVNSQYAGMFQENAIARYNVGINVGYRAQPNGAGIFLTGRVTGSQVYNNTIIQTDATHNQAISFNNWGGEWPDNNFIYNNIFYTVGAVGTFNRASRYDDLGNLLSNNLYWGTISPPVDGTTPLDINPLTADPMFANPTGNTAVDFKVGAGSAAIGAGRLIADNGGADYYGSFLSPTAPPTVGFYEYSSDPGVNTAPQFAANPLIFFEATAGYPYTASLAGLASDVDGQPLSYSKLDGPDWLTVSEDGTVSGMPEMDDRYGDGWTVVVDDGWGGTDSATLLVPVLLGVKRTLVGGAVLNGDFNAGVEGSFSVTPSWQNLVGNSSDQATRTDLDFDGTLNAVLASNKIFGLDTGYILTEGDVFDLSYVWRDAYLWDDMNDEVRVSLFVTSDDTLFGTRTDLVTRMSGTSTEDSTFEWVNQDGIYKASADVSGQRLFLSVDTTSVQGFARLDNFELLYRTRDSDSDAMADSWELIFFGDLLTSEGGAADFDRDGLLDVDESILGTDPRDGQSGLLLKGQVSEGTGDTFNLDFHGVAGRSYMIEVREALSSEGGWNYIGFVGPVVTDGIQLYPIPLSNGLKSMFARVRVVEGQPDTLPPALLVDF